MIDDQNVWLGFQRAGMTLLATTVSQESVEVKRKKKGACNAKTDLIFQTAPSTFKSSMGSHVLELRVCLSSTAKDEATWRPRGALAPCQLSKKSQ